MRPAPEDKDPDSDAMEADEARQSSLSKGAIVDRLKRSFESLDWPSAKAILDLIGADAHVTEIQEALRRSGRLILKHPSSQEEKRDLLLARLREYLSSNGPDAVVPQAIDDALTTLQVAEQGYRKLSAQLALTPASRLKSEVHVAASLVQAGQQFIRIEELVRRQQSTNEFLTIDMVTKDEQGNSFDVDGALERCTDFVSITIQMESHRAGWLDEQGNVVLPRLPNVSEQDVHLAESTMQLAVLWKRWGFVEEAARYQGRVLRIQKPREPLALHSSPVTTMVVEEGDDCSDFIHRVAFERLTSKLNQNLVEYGADLGFGRQYPRPSASTPVVLDKGVYISLEEIAAVNAIEQMLAVDVFSDSERHGGLRLIEWIRGYSSLKRLAIDGGANALRTRSGWLHYFSGYGLSAEAAGQVIENLTFRSTSRDLYDHPFLKHEDGTYRLFMPAVRYANVAMVVFSALSHLSADLGAKGARFEKATRATLGEAGLQTYSFKARRGAQEYQYDVLLPWGDYLFLLECKNRALPLGRPGHMRFFDEATQRDIEQLKRLVKGLELHPDMLEEHLPKEVRTKKIIPVIFHCFPYSVPGPIQGVYFYDYSALSRFLESPEISLKVGSQDSWTHSFPTGLRLWAGDKPSADDLLLQMQRSHQFEHVRSQLRPDQSGFPLPPDWWVASTDYTRQESHDLTKAREAWQVQQAHGSRKPATSGPGLEANS